MPSTRLFVQRETYKTKREYHIGIIFKSHPAKGICPHGGVEGTCTLYMLTARLPVQLIVDLLVSHPRGTTKASVPRRWSSPAEKSVEAALYMLLVIGCEYNCSGLAFFTLSPGLISTRAPNCKNSLQRIQREITYTCQTLSCAS